MSWSWLSTTQTTVSMLELKHLHRGLKLARPPKVPSLELRFLNVTTSTLNSIVAIVIMNSATCNPAPWNPHIKLTFL